MAPPRIDPVIRFAQKLSIDDPDDCWLWLAATDRDGYAVFAAGGRCSSMSAHRWAYEYFIGPIPVGLTLDHVCHNRDLVCNGGITCLHRRCVNPAHLDPVTAAVNAERSPHTPNGLTWDECGRGHAWTPQNTRIGSQGQRICITCSREYQRIYYQTVTKPRLLACAS